MDKSLEDKIYELGQYRGGVLVRIAYHLSRGMTQIAACEAEGKNPEYLRHNDFLEKDAPQKALMKEVAKDLSIYRIKNAVELSSIALQEGATRAAQVLVGQLDHVNPKIRQNAANAILDKLGVNASNLIEIEGGLTLNLDEMTKKALDRIYADISEDGTDKDA